jgi:hypothetical protein
MAAPAQLTREAAPRVAQPGGAVEAAGVLRPVVYEGGPAPPAHALQPRSAHLATPAVRDSSLRAERGGDAGAGGDAAELRARLAGRPGLRARHASHARAQGRPADPGDGGAVPDAPRAFTLYPLDMSHTRAWPSRRSRSMARWCSRPGASRRLGDRRSPAWRATQLGAAFAAIDAPTVKLTDRRWWAAQTPERLARTAALLSIHPGQSAPDAEAIAFRLDVPRLVLQDAADAYAHALGRAARGRVLVGVLDQLGADGCLLDRSSRPVCTPGAGGR